LLHERDDLAADLVEPCLNFLLRARPAVVDAKLPVSLHELVLDLLQLPDLGPHLLCQLFRNHGCSPQSPACLSSGSLGGSGRQVSDATALPMSFFPPCLSAT